MFAEFVSPAALAAQLEPLAEVSLAALRAGHRSPLYAQLASELRAELEARQAVTETVTEGAEAEGHAEGGPVETALEAPAVGAGQSDEEEDHEEPEDPLLAALLQLVGGRQARARTARSQLLDRSLPEQRRWRRRRQWSGAV